MCPADQYSFFQRINLGIGAKIFAELGFLADEKKFNPTDDWLSITGKLESPDFKFEITKWHLNSIETCKKYNSVIMFTDDFQNTNEIILSVECPGCTGTGYKAVSYTHLDVYKRQWHH